MPLQRMFEVLVPVDVQKRPDPTQNAGTGNKHYHGHRQRLRDRFMRAGPEALPDYELLELLLFGVIPKRDTKPLAKRLLATFEDFAHVITAPPDRLIEIKGVGPAVITHLKTVEASAQRMLATQIRDKEVISSWDALVKYCRVQMGFRPTEEFRILFLDNQNVLIADEAQQTGTVDHVPVYPREVVARALQLKAKAIILVHNHPSGDPTPSDADISMTRNIEAALAPVEIRVHDHIIVGKERVLSFHDEGYM